jgi:hypothetical protein|tara:strand:+ start:1362 stop:1520 length:159 start_codon:yes stop_codon:yes gene_type:complete
MMIFVKKSANGQPPRLYTGPIISLLTIEKELLAYQINQFGAMKHIVLYCGAL